MFWLTLEPLQLSETFCRDKNVLAIINSLSGLGLHVSGDDLAEGGADAIMVVMVATRIY